jgi:hypothetical protein
MTTEQRHTTKTVDCSADWGFSHREANRAKTINEEFGAPSVTTEHENRTRFNGTITGGGIGESMALLWGCLVALTIIAIASTSAVVLIMKYAKEVTG